MQEQLDQNPWLKKTRWLSHALILSGALNLGLLGTFFTMTYKNLRRVTPNMASENSSHKVPYISSSGIELLSEYFNYTYEQLKKELESKELVEDGYAKRDYALTCLVGLHDFDICKALAGRLLQTRVVEIVHKEGGERLHLEMFPGLDDAHFNALINFARVEKWPFTPQGLYAKMQGIQRHLIPDSLKEAFYLTPHFYYLRRLFWQEDHELSQQALLEGLLEGQWEMINTCYQELCKTQDFGLESRRKLLLQLLQKKSSFAVRFFLEHDREFAFAKLDDHSMTALIQQISSKLPHAESFVRKLLVSVRSDEVLKAAGCKLYEFVGEAPPTPYDHGKALMRFLPNFFDKTTFTPKERRHEVESVIPLAPDKKWHVVVKGDTLWKIAEFYHTDLKALMKKNHLTSTTVIKPGMKLELP